MRQNILIIDNEAKFSSRLARVVELEGYCAILAKTGKEGLKVLSNVNVQVVLSDTRLPDINGGELVRLIRDKKPYVEVIYLTASGNIHDVVIAMKNGAFDYITKGDDNEKILPLLAKAVEKAALQYSLLQIENKQIGQHSFEVILGESPAIKNAINLARKVSATHTTVLLLGETGTGKEIFARAIHYNSDRKSKSFVAINCSTFSAELMESELFGYKAGAFTGAQKDKKGLVEEADGGTLFLDEIGEISYELQAKLLRVLEAGEFIKIGDTKTRKINARLIAATNRNLELEIGKGHFRQDLFYRLSVFVIHLPALNERKEDIKLLAGHYLAEYALKLNPKIKYIDPAFLYKLEHYNWKGNVRELKNFIERAVILCDGDTLTTDLLPAGYEPVTEPTGIFFEMAAVERNHIRKILNYTKGNKAEAARLMGLGVTTLYRKIAKYQGRGCFGATPMHYEVIQS